MGQPIHLKRCQCTACSAPADAWKQRTTRHVTVSNPNDLQPSTADAAENLRVLWQCKAGSKGATRGVAALAVCLSVAFVTAALWILRVLMRKRH